MTEARTMSKNMFIKFMQLTTSQKTNKKGKIKGNKFNVSGNFPPAT